MSTTIEQEVERQASPAEDGVVSTDDAKRHLLKNMASQIILFIFTAVTSLYFVPYQIHHLGLANYGIVTLAYQVVHWTDILSLAIVGTVGRFVTLNIARGELGKARVYFNTQFIAVLCLASALVPIALVVSSLTPEFARIPPGQESYAKIHFFLTYLVLICGLFTSIFQVGAWMKQRQYIRNSLEIANQSVGYIVWILMFSLVIPRIWHIGFGRLLGALFVLAGNYIVFRRLMPQLSPKLRGFDGRKFKETIKMGGWMTVGRTGAMLYLFFDAIIINRLMDADSLGRYSAIVGLSGMLRSFTFMTWAVMGPIAIAHAARSDWSGLLRTTTKATKFLSLGLGISLGVFCGMASFLLGWWLGPDYKPYAPLVWVLFSHLVLNQGMDPLFSLNYATNKMAVPGIATVCGGIIKVVLAIVLIKYTSLGLYGIAIADAIALTLRNLVFAPIYSGIILKTNPWPLYKSVMPAAVVFMITSALAWTISRALSPYGFASLAGLGTGIMAVSALCTWSCLFPQAGHMLLYCLRQSKCSAMKLPSSFLASQRYYSSAYTDTSNTPGRIFRMRLLRISAESA